MLRKHRELDNFEARLDPTVIPVAREAKVKFTWGSLDKIVELSERSQSHSYSVGDYHNAYKTGKLTPIAVAKALLKLIQKPSVHNTAFLDIREAILLEKAAASTKRYQDGNPISIIDGVPVGVKDEVDLDGYATSLGSSQDFTTPIGGTSWCVKKWEEAGAMVIGKLNMHELGLGKR